MPKFERELSTKEKQMASKFLRNEYALSYSQIAKTLGIGKISAFNYVKMEIVDEDKRFYDAVKGMVKLKEEELAIQALTHLEKKMPQARFFELVGFYKTIRELQGRGMGTAPEVPSTVIVTSQGIKILQIVQKAEKDAKEVIESEIKNE